MDILSRLTAIIGVLFLVLALAAFLTALRDRRRGDAVAWKARSRVALAYALVGAALICLEILL